MSSLISAKLLSWYAHNKRQLPWRDHPTPYHVWVGEVMAQQTRLDTVISYYQRWLERFPDEAALASASQQEVLHLWQGLGYYSRARNLHQAAMMIMQEFNGVLPKDVARLQKLPGIGPYTAGAIASIAFGQDTPAVDGNVKRVLARLFNLPYEVNSYLAEKAFWDRAQEMLPAGNAAEFNQALMDLGSSICTPRSPLCSECPLSEQCQANILDLQSKLPRRKSKPSIPHYTVTGAVILKKDQILIAQRPLHGLLGGMWEFPGGKQERGETLQDCLQREIKEELGIKVIVGEEIGVFKHAYTHFKVTLHAFLCQLNGGYPQPVKVNDLRWVQLPELTGFPMGKIDRMITERLIDLQKSTP